MTVHVVTDSSCDLPADVLQRESLHVLPLRVRFGDTVAIDQREIDARRFYELLETRPEHPFTEPPPEEEVAARLSELSASGDVVAVLISSRLSRVHGYAETAARELRGASAGGRAIEVVDSRSVSLGLGLQAVIAARLAARGLDAATLADQLRALAEGTRMVFVAPSLDFALRGRKLNRLEAFLGSALGGTLTLTVEGGEVVPTARPGSADPVDSVVRWISKAVDPARPCFLAVAHARAPVWAHRVSERLAARTRILELLAGEVGPAVAAHIGPGVVGAAVLQPTTEVLARLGVP